MRNTLGAGRLATGLLAGAACVALALSGCGEVTVDGGSGSGGDGGGATGGDGGSDGGGAAAYAITDLCAQADLSPLQAVLPVITGLTPQSRQESGYTAYYCDGQASGSDAFDDLGFISLAAYVYEDPAEAADAYETTLPSEPIAGLGQQARFADEGGFAVEVEVLDGPLFLTAHWNPNSREIPEGVGDALVATVRATLPKLMAG